MDGVGRARARANIDWRRAALIALSVGGVIVFWAAFRTGGPGFDFYAYWAVDPAHPYDRMFETLTPFVATPRH